MQFNTADLCDANPGAVAVAEPLFRDFGAQRAFGGQIATVKVFEDNVLVRQALERPGQGRVLVVDGGGSVCCALVGGLLAGLAVRNGWAGIVVNGAVRDVEELDRTGVGIKALAANPLRSRKAGIGEEDCPVSFAGVTFTPGHFLYADADGIIVAARSLTS